MSNLVFICHASEDAEVANMICNQLEKSSVKCWIAPRDTEAGNFMGSLTKAIKNCTIFVLIYSEYSNKSPHVTRELERAINLDIPIVPFRLNETPPSEAMEYAISSQHWIDGFPGEIEKHISILIEKVKQKININGNTNSNTNSLKAINYVGIQVTDEGLNILVIKEPNTIEKKFKTYQIGKNSDERELQNEIINVIEDVTYSIGNQTMMDVNEIKNISIVLPGPVIDEGGKIQFTSRVRSNSGPEISMRSFLNKKLRYDGNVCLFNDANAAAKAEYYLRNLDPVEQHRTRSLIYILWGGGIGGGIIIDGNLISGHNGYAGEIGHSKISSLGPVCNCGSTGCLEAYLSEDAIKRIICQSFEKQEKLFFRYNSDKFPAPKLPPLLNRKNSPKVPDNIDIENFLQFAQRSDDPTLSWQNDVIDQISNIWALALTNLLYHLDPELIVFGGKLGRCVNPVLFDYIRIEISTRIFISEYRMEKTRFNQYAAIIGAYPEIDKMDENDQLRNSIIEMLNDTNEEV